MTHLSINLTKEKGFTLIELLIVVAIISILAIVSMVALKPAQRLADARDARRGQDMRQLLTGIHECGIDKKDGSSMTTCLGANTTGTTYEIVSGAVTSGCQSLCTMATSDSSCLRLDVTLTDYFTSLPKDPSLTGTGHTGYALTRYSNGMVVIDACGAEMGPIKVSQ